MPIHPVALLIAGASTRSAAFSAIRAGFVPTCLDFFADQDLRAVCHSERVSLNSSSLERTDPFVESAQRFASSPWIYTGSFENSPKRVDEVSARHRLWGNSSAVTEQVRDPFTLSRVLVQEGVSVPRASRTIDGLPFDGSWLAKPFASAGGLGIHRLTSRNYTTTSTSRYYFQEYVRGHSHSALFLGESHSRCSLIGVTRQFHGARNQAFAYRGNLGPLVVEDPLAEQLASIGRALVSNLQLRGLFGVDFIWDRAKAWVVEVNPRYTASVEIHELANRRALLSEHRRVCESDLLASHGLKFDPDIPPGKCVGKWVLYAARRMTAPELPIGPPLWDDPFFVPEIADIPEAGTVVNVGEPVLSVFGEGRNAVECARALRTNVNHWRKILGVAS